MLYLIGLLVVLGLLVMSFYNRFVKSKNKMGDAWGAIDVQLKRRYDLIPNLVETVKGYATHEREIFENLAKARNAAIGAGNVNDQQAAENMLTQSLKSLFALSEAYPDLKANTNFQQLQEQLGKVEDDLQMARRYYNAVVRDNNNIVETFPGNVFAGMFGFTSQPFFEIDAAQKEAPKISF